MKSETINILIS